MLRSCGLPFSTDSTGMLWLQSSLWGLAWLFLFTWCASLALRVRSLGKVSVLDPLTGLLNGRIFDAERWPAALRLASPLAVVFVDLDHLKQNNDRFGKSAGDRYIVSAVQALQRACRRGVDQLFRLHTAGDEFVLLLHGNDALHAEKVAGNLLRQLRAAGISASIGAASTTQHSYSDRDALMAQAEAAMRTAKQRGRDCVFMASHTEITHAVDSPVPQEISDAPSSLRHQLRP